MSHVQILSVIIPVAYVLGSIPFGLIVGLAKGVDPRTAGSGNIGATNVGRLLGGRFFAIVFTLDLLKGLCPMLVAAFILHGQPQNRLNYILWLLVGVAAIAGHMFSCFLKFKGGKGVATSLGVALGVFPYYTFPGVIAAAGFVVVFLLSRIVSISSIAAVVVFLVSYIVMGILCDWDILGSQLPLLIFAMLLCAMIVYRHRSNIARLLAGTENRFSRSTHK